MCLPDMAQAALERTRAEPTACCNTPRVPAITRLEQVHVLIDIDYNKLRLSILALRPAALQCAWLAHPGTTGAEFVDYLIKDQVVAPPEIAQPFIREGLVYMKHHYQVRSSR